MDTQQKLKAEFVKKFTQFVSDNQPGEAGEEVSEGEFDGIAVSLHAGVPDWELVEWHLEGKWTDTLRDKNTKAHPQLWGDRQTGLLMGHGDGMPSSDDEALFWLSDHLYPDTDCSLNLKTGEYQYASYSSDGVHTRGKHIFDEFKFDWAGHEEGHLYISFKDEETLPAAARAMLNKGGLIAKCKAWAEGHDIESGDKILGDIEIGNHGVEGCEYWLSDNWGAADEAWDDNWVKYALQDWKSLEMASAGHLSVMEIGIGVDGEGPIHWSVVIEQSDERFCTTALGEFVDIGVETVLDEWEQGIRIREQMRTGEMHSVEAFRAQMVAVLRDADQYGNTRADIRLLAGEGMV